MTRTVHLYVCHQRGLSFAGQQWAALGAEGQKVWKDKAKVAEKEKKLKMTAERRALGRAPPPALLARRPLRCASRGLCPTGCNTHRHTHTTACCAALEGSPQIRFDPLGIACAESPCLPSGSERCPGCGGAWAFIGDLPMNETPYDTVRIA